MSERSFSTAIAASEPLPAAQEAILRSALGWFSRAGFHGASMREIAVGAGVSVGNIYNYYGSKEQILLEILRKANAEQMAATEAAIAAASGDVRARFCAAVAAFVRYDIEEQEACFVANSELHYLRESERAQITAERDRHQEIFERLVEEGIASGAFKTPYPREATRAVLTMCSGVTLWYKGGGSLDAGAVAKRYSRYALALVEGL